MDLNLQSAATLGFGVLVLASGSILAAHKLKRLRGPQIEFFDLVYDKAARQVELFVVNEGDKPVYVNPSLRLVHFLNPEEWREKKSNGNGNGSSSNGNMLAGKCYQVDSVIKGYSLIGECTSPVKVDNRSMRKIIYPLGDDISLRVYDNVRVDSLYGFNRVSDDRIVSMMRVVLKDGVEVGLNETSAPSVEPAESPALPSPNYCVMPGVNGGVVATNDSPVQALCMCCGKERSLDWVVDGNDICLECKDFLTRDLSTTCLADSGIIPMLPEPEAKVFLDEPKCEKAECSLDGGSEALKPRQKEILRLLEHENNLTVKKISKILSVNESTVASDLKMLMEKDLVGRIEVGKRHLYHLT